MISRRVTFHKGRGFRAGNGRSDDLWHTGLMALAHPAGLASIALLLLNDHFLKRQFPSAITGKLSDFAGLFFFPFLVTAAFGLAEKATRGRKPAAPAGWPGAAAASVACFALTALAFAAVKVVPAANQAATAALETLLGLPVRIVRDPTDLAALAALWPAWKLWRALGSRRERPPAGRSLLALGLASLASLATSCLPIEPVSHLVTVEDGVYALTTSWEHLTVLWSSDGDSWDTVVTESVPPEVLAAAAVPAALPKVVCVPGLERICYRVSGGERLETSEDGGATWQTTWAAPTTRRSYMERLASAPICGKTIDFSANDVLVLGDGLDHVVLVALGNEGVLRGPPWSRVSVGSAQATPDRGTVQDLLFSFIIIGETLAAVLVGAIGLWVLSEVSWRVHRRPGVRRSRTPWVVAAITILLVMLLLSPTGVWVVIPYALAPVVLTAAFGAYLWSGWLQAIGSTEDAHKARGALGTSLLGGFSVALAAWTPFALWVLGVIPGYSAAVGVALVASAAVLILSWRNMGRREAATSAA